MISSHGKHWIKNMLKATNLYVEGSPEDEVPTNASDSEVILKRR